MGPNAESGISNRPVPYEPMYISAPFPSPLLPDVCFEALSLTLAASSLCSLQPRHLGEFRRDRL